MQSAEVVIVGGGIVGSSIANHLTAAGCKNVLVIERETAQIGARQVCLRQTMTCRHCPDAGSPLAPSSHGSRRFWD